MVSFRDVSELVDVRALQPGERPALFLSDAQS
jgi:hypothetical protein